MAMTAAAAAAAGWRASAENAESEIA